MNRDEMIASLKDQAKDKDILANGEKDSIFTRDAQALREAAEMLEKSEAVKQGRGTEGMMPTDHKRTYSQRGDDYLIEAQRVCGEDKPAPLCPYCGESMVAAFTRGFDEKINAWYMCNKCLATGPPSRRQVTQAEARHTAYVAAMQRCVEPNHPLTLEEVKEQRAVWLEENLCEPVPALFYIKGYPHHSVFIGAFGKDEDFDENVWYDNEDYGVEWRCWLRKPTVEERVTTPWGEQAP